MVQGPLDQTNAPRCAGDSCGNLLRRFGKLRCREDFGDEPDTLGLMRIYRLAEEKQLHGFAEADEARQDKTTAGVRRQTDAHKGLNELRLFGSDPQVTGQSQIATCSGGNAVDGGDYDLFHLPDLADYRIILLA